MSNGEDAPFRLDQDRAKAMAAAGVPNASRETERLERNMRGTVKIADLDHLSPLAPSPQYAVQANIAVGAALFGTLELVCPVPWILRLVEATGNTVEVARVATTQITVPVAGTQFLDGVEPVAPRQMTISTGTAPVPISGVFVESNRNIAFDLPVAPGEIIAVQANVAATQLTAIVIVQELPGGLARPT